MVASSRISQIGRTMLRQASFLVLLSAIKLVQSQESHVDYPVGCFSFGYQYQPSMVNISGMPYKLGSVTQCQMKCRATLGCVNFGYFTATQECWLGGIASHLVPGSVQGVIAGPATCPTDPPACRAIPGPDFPGATDAASRAAWPEMFEQPTNLQCWPRKEGGFPAMCSKRMAKVLEDTAAGWPGRCDMENFKIISNLQGNETCQSRCFQSTLCGVWMIQNSSGSNVCYHSMIGINCYKSTGPSPVRAQRIMHGSYRKLMETAGVQIKHLVQAFEVTMFPKWEDGAARCRLTCLSYLFCQYWQYSSVYGCWIEEPAKKEVAYPLYNHGDSMNMSNGASIKAGEYIQHECPATLKFEPPPYDPDPVPAAVAPPPTASVEGTRSARVDVDTAIADVDKDAGGSGLSFWAIVLIGLAVLALVAIAGFGVYTLLMKNGKSARKTRGIAAGAGSASYDASFTSQASSAHSAAMQQNAGGYGFGGNYGSHYHQGYGHQYPPTQHYAGYGHVPQQPPTMPGTYRGWG